MNPPYLGRCLYGILLRLPIAQIPENAKHIGNVNRNLNKQVHVQPAPPPHRSDAGVFNVTETSTSVNTADMIVSVVHLSHILSAFLAFSDSSTLSTRSPTGRPAVAAALSVMWSMASSPSNNLLSPSMQVNQPIC